MSKSTESFDMIFDFDKLNSLYVIRMKVTNLTPLSIGSGKSLTGGVDNPIIKRDGKPYIPGSSLKGVFRAEAERFARTVFGVNSDIVCNILNPQEEIEREKNGKPPCLICQIFGGPTIGSHISFHDAVAEDEKYTIGSRRCVSISRATGGQYHGRLYDIEYVNPGAVFDLVIEIENIDILDASDRRGTVLRYLLKRLFTTGIEVGARKSIGMGKIAILGVNSLNITEIISNAFFNVTKFSIKPNGDFEETDVTKDFLKTLGFKL